MPGLTPVKVRGKRNAIKQEKWHSGKQRKIARGDSVTSSEQSSRSSTPSLVAQRRTQHAINVSGFTALPTEILQYIFGLSCNVNFPLASSHLAERLKSRHLYMQITSQTLHEVFGCSGHRASAMQLAAANRLMNSKFFTWTFFREWLHEEYVRLDLFNVLQNDVGAESALVMASNRREEWVWYKLQPDDRLLPPSKLLRGPFTSDNIRFLSFLMSSFRGDTDQLDPIYKELAQEGLEQAVGEGAGEALGAFWTLGLLPDTALLRRAVIDSRCDQEVVRRLITRLTHLSSEPIQVDFLDPALWSWADKANQAGDEKGSWLMGLLREAARDSGRKDIEIDRAKFKAMIT